MTPTDQRRSAVIARLERLQGLLSEEQRWFADLLGEIRDRLTNTEGKAAPTDAELHDLQEILEKVAARLS